MSDNQEMNISDEAVEAAANVLWLGGTKEPHRLRTLRAALKAAAPHLMAQAWEEGWQGGAGWPQVETNPYRSAGAGE